MVEESKINTKNLVSLFKKNGFNKVHGESTPAFDITEFNLTPIKLDVQFITPFIFPKKKSIRN